MIQINIEFIIIIITVILICYGLYYVLRTPSIKTNIFYPDHSYVVEKYKTTPYYKSLNQFDLKTRSSLTKAQLLYKVSMSLITPSEEQKGKIEEICRKADQLMIKQGYGEIAKYDWNIVLFSGIENNYPHTHDNMIFLPNNFYDIETYIHEKVHIYQRRNRNRLEKDISNLGFSFLGDETVIPRDILSRIRHNPDFDDLSIWGNRYIPMEVFSSDSLTIADSRMKVYDTLNKELIDEPDEYLSMFSDVNQREHPYEILACRIAKECVLGV